MPKDEYIDDVLSVSHLKVMQRIADNSSPHSPYFDNIRGYQKLSEIAIVEDWAKEIRKQGHSVCKIKLNVDDNGNPDDPPDVLAEMNGIPVGIEVTNLVEYVCQNQNPIYGPDKVTILKWKQSQGQIDFSWCGSDLDEDERKKVEQKIRENPRMYQGGWVLWTPECFQQRLRHIVKTKDEKTRKKKKKQGSQALECRLQQQFLLIFTPELYLQDDLDAYVNKTELPRPKNFDRVFVMGDGIPQSGNSGIRREHDPETSNITYREVGPNLAEQHHPVFEVRLNN